MTKLATTLRVPFDRADQVRYSANAANPSTNVQQAIDFATSIAASPTKPANLTAVIVNAAMSPFAMQATHYLIEVDTSAGPVTINANASALRNNLPVTVKDIGGMAGTNAVSIVFSGAEKADTLGPYVIDTNYGDVYLQPKAAGGYTVL